MKPGGSRRKGNDFENEVAKEVISAFADFGMTRADCYRTPGSGGHQFAKQQDPGDLVVSARMRVLFPFAVECKAYKEVAWWRFFIDESKWQPSWIEGHWLTQAAAASTNNEMPGVTVFPLVVIKENKVPWIIAVDEAYFPPNVKVTELPGLRFVFNSRSWRLMPFSTFLNIVVACVKVKMAAPAEPKKKLLGVW